MSAAPNNAISSALSQALSGLQAAGQFRVLALADARGLAWALAGETPAPDLLAAVPSLLSRAFVDRQPLLRFFSDKVMRFEYRSDTMAYIKAGQTGARSGADFTLDVPGAKEGRDPKSPEQAREFVVGWDEEYLVLRDLDVNGEVWCLLGISSNPVTARLALQKAAPGVASIISSARGAAPAGPNGSDQALHPRLIATLESFRSAAPDIHMAAVTSKDGFVVASLDGATLDADLMAPLMGHSFLAIQESTQRLCGSTESVLLRMDEGILMARELTDDLLFAALLAPSACTGLILSAFETTANALRDALNALTSAVSARPDDARDERLMTPIEDEAPHDYEVAV